MKKVSQDRPSLTNKELAKIHSALKEMLTAVVAICDRHGLQYYLVDGTLLGAVRHKGFIPWDDDVDIAMDSAQIQLFMQYAKNELPKHMYADAAFSSERRWIFSPDQTRVYRDDIEILDIAGQKTHLWIDIMQLVNVPKGNVYKKLYCISLKMCKAMTRISAPEIIGVHYWKNKTFFRRMAIIAIKRANLGRILCHQKWMQNLEKLLNRYSHIADSDMMIYPSAYWEKEIVPREWYGDGVMGELGGIQVRMPTEYHKLLTRLYDDYMTLPPEEKRVPSHVQKIEEPCRH